VKKALLIPYRDFVCDKSYRTANRINTNTYLLHLTFVAADGARHLSGRSLQSAIRFRFCASTKATPKIFGVFMPHCVCPEKLRISKSF